MKSKILKFIFIFLFSIFYSIIFFNSALASPRWLRLSWNSTDRTDTTMTISWTDSDPGGGVVEFREYGGTSRTLNAIAEDTGSGVLDITYTVTLTGLSPSTTYEYRVQSAGTWSDWKQFATPPPIKSCSPVRIIAGGDGRGGEAFWDPGYVSRHWDNILNYIKNEAPNLMVYSGDIVHDGSEDRQWEEWLNISEPLTSVIPFLAVLGNHDDGPGDGDNQWFNKIFAQPKSGAGVLNESFDPDGDGIEDFWAIVVANVLLIGLSTEGVPPAPQHAFLQNVISTWDSQVDWKILFFHRPLWSSGAHGSNDGDMLDANNLIGIIDDYGIDFVICGHDHDYERMHPAKGGYGGRPRIITPLPDDGGNSGVAQGPIHIVSGGAGSFTNFVMFCRVDACFVASGNLNYMVMDFLGDRVSVVVRDLGPILTLNDATMRPEPLDSFTVLKASSICQSQSTEEEEMEIVPEIADDMNEQYDNDFMEETTGENQILEFLDIMDTIQNEDMGNDSEQDVAGEINSKKGCGCILIR